MSITVNGQKLLPWDPFARSEKATQELQKQLFEIEYGESVGVVTLRRFVLPGRDQFSSLSEFERLSGPLKWNRQQGLYTYRADRLIQWGGWAGIRSIDEHTKLARASVEFNTDLDAAFNINVAKMRASIPAQLRQMIERPINEMCSLADEVYRKSSDSRQDGMGSRAAICLGGSRGRVGPEGRGRSGGRIQGLQADCRGAAAEFAGYCRGTGHLNRRHAQLEQSAFVDHYAVLWALRASGHCEQSGNSGRQKLFASSMRARCASREYSPMPIMRATASRPSVNLFFRSAVLAWKRRATRSTPLVTSTGSSGSAHSESEDWALDQQGLPNRQWSQAIQRPSSCVRRSRSCLRILKRGVAQFREPSRPCFGVRFRRPCPAISQRVRLAA